jgi:hypothetical protein
MKQVNVFHKGITSDIDNSLVQQDMWVFPTMGARIMNLSGKGYVVQNIDGTKELFTLGAKNIPIGAVEHDGIIYIATHNIDTNEGTIGSYPSPLNWASGNNGLANTYKPLKNFMISGVRNNLTTELFNFSLSNKVSMQSKTSYDGSVDIYMADYRNPLRMVNSGFKKDGTVLERTIEAEDFSTFVNVIQSTANSPKFAFKPFGDNGDLLNGNYFVYARYVTDDFNATEFLSESFAFSLYQEREENNAFSEGGISTESSNRSINFTLSNVDQSYKYLEFGLVRYYGDNGPVQYETYLYNQYFNITSEEMDINLAYWDRVIPFPEQELFAARNRDIIPKDIVYFDNTLWGGNWKEKDRYRKVLEEYAKRVMIFPKTLSVGDNAFVLDNRTVNVNRHYIPGDVYENPQYIYENVGYFRGETYAFALNYSFDDGDITDGYPTAGRDDYNNDTCYNNIPWVDYEDSEKFNQDGFYRTPKADLICDDDEDKFQLLKAGDRRLLYLQFDFTEANRWLNEDCNDDDKEWFIKNIDALRVVRSERKENIVTQGLAMLQIKSTGNIQNILQETGHFPNLLNKRFVIGSPVTGLKQYYPDDEDFDDPDWRLEDLNFAHRVYGGEADLASSGIEHKYPYYKGYIPMWGQLENTGFLGVGKKFNTASYATRGVPVANDYGVFCPDYIFNRAMFLDNVNYVKRVGRNVDTLLEAKYYDNVFPQPVLSAMSEIVSIDRDATVLAKKAIGMIGNETIINGGGHDSRCICEATDLQTPTTAHLYATRPSGTRTQTISNRSFGSLPYISILLNQSSLSADITQTITDFQFKSEDIIGEPRSYNLDSVNLCVANPDDLDIEQWYSKQTLFYKPISDFIPFEVIGEEYKILDLVNQWRGDCFLNRCTLNVFGWLPTDAKTGEDGELTVGDNIVDIAGHRAYDYTPGKKDRRYAHGLTLSLVTENRHNAAYRYHNRKAQNTYFDREVGGGLQRKGIDWLIRAWKGTVRESTLLNTGNSVVIPQKLIPIYPYLQPYNSNIHPTRIRFSGRYTPGAFLDATRKFETMHYKDFDYAYGAINALYHQSGMLISIQDSMINRHYVNEKALQVDGEGNSLMLGTSSEYLAQQVSVVGQFGSKHQWGTYANEMAIYGVDWDRSIIWKTGFAEGSSYYRAADISLSKSVRTWLENIYKHVNPTSDPTVKLPDTPANEEGIIIGYDRLNKEMLFTFLLWKDVTEREAYDRFILLPVNDNSWVNVEHNPNYLVSYNGSIYFANRLTHVPPISNSSWTQINQDDVVWFDDNTVYQGGDIVIGYYNNELYIVMLDKSMSAPVASINLLFKTTAKPVGNRSLNIYNFLKVKYLYQKMYRKTLVLSEKNDAFIGEFPFTPSFYGILDNAMFSSNPNQKESIHIHNQPDKTQEFYGNVEEWCISFVVTGQSGEESAAMIMKYFMSLDIEINDVELSKITYKTDIQEGVYLYSKNSDEFWKDAEYFENKMKLPIFVQTNPNTEWENGTQEFYQGSDMKGTYMVITLHYKPTEVEKITLRNAITNFNISQS